MNAIAAPTLTAESLWTRARAMFARAVAAIGDATAIAVTTSLPRVLRREIVGWLCPLEYIVRKLLLAEAAELHRIERARIAREPRIERIPLRGMAMHWRPGNRTASFQARNGAAVAEKGEPESSRSMLDKSQPRTWRARFSFALPRNTRFVSNARAPRIRDPWRDYAPPPEPPPRTPRVIAPEDAPFRLARRFEALRRVLEDPAPHAARLARVLAREARRVPQLVLRYMLAGPRTDTFDPADSRLSLEALGAAYNSPDAFKDTS